MAYAVPACSGDGTTASTRPYGGTPGGVTFFQFEPPSRVSCTSPSSVPTQISPRSSGDPSTYENRVGILGARNVERERTARRLLMVFQVERKVGADRRPMFAAIARLKEHASAVPHRLRIPRCERDRRIPVEPVLALRDVEVVSREIRVRSDAAARLRRAVEKIDAPVLQIRVDQVSVGGVGHGPHSVAADDVDPVVVFDAFAIQRVGRAAESVVILQAAANEIRILVRGRDVIELADREIA